MIRLLSVDLLIVVAYLRTRIFPVAEASPLLGIRIGGVESCQEDPLTAAPLCSSKILALFRNP